MAKSNVPITRVERTFGEDELIVSKTDLRGAITYANQIFIDISGYTEAELLGQPHSILRHPDMPRCVFKLLWDTISQGDEIFAYVLNRCKNGDHYWVFAHVTPSRDLHGSIVGYHSSRRKPEPSAVRQISEIYALLKKEEESHGDRHLGLQRSYELLVKYLGDKKTAYDEFVFSLT